MKKLVAVALIICAACLSGCIMSPVYIIKQNLGYYPYSSDFPDTEWKCRELDLSLCVSPDCVESGTYTVNGVSYCVGFCFRLGEISIEFFPASSLPEDGAYPESERLGYAYGGYEYHKDEGLLVCNIVTSAPVDGETIPEKLTFDLAASAAKGEKP